MQMLLVPAMFVSLRSQPCVAVAQPSPAQHTPPEALNNRQAHRHAAAVRIAPSSTGVKGKQSHMLLAGRQVAHMSGEKSAVT